jgi:hypothetical protein
MWRDFYEDSSSEEVVGRIPWHAVDIVERKDRWVRERGIEAYPSSLKSIMAMIDFRRPFLSSSPGSEDRCLAAL